MTTLDDVMHAWLREQPEQTDRQLAALQDLHRRISDWSSWDWLDEPDEVLMPHSPEEMLRVLNVIAGAIRAGGVKAVFIAVLEKTGGCSTCTTGLSTRVERLGMLARAMHLENE